MFFFYFPNFDIVGGGRRLYSRAVFGVTHSYINKYCNHCKCSNFSKVLHYYIRRFCAKIRIMSILIVSGRHNIYKINHVTACSKLNHTNLQLMK